MSSSSLIKALLLPAAAVAAFAAPLLGSSPASAATCQADPYNGVCVSTTNYTVKTPTGAKLAVQRTPKSGNTLRSIANGTTVAVICQVNNGGTTDGKTSTTWNAIAGGGWVYNAYLNTPAAGADGYSPGIRHCGAASATSTYNAASYPWANQDGWVSDGHGYYQSECVSFAAWAVRTDGLAHTKSPDFMGNANLWTGAYVDATPHVGDVAQWDGGRNGAGSVGHVAYVVAVNADGSVLVNEYNWGGFHRFNARTIAANVPSRYLHF